MEIKKTLLILLTLFTTGISFAQKKEHKIKIGLGTSLFNLNESFSDLFVFNNSSPIYISLTTNNKFRYETILNLSIINNKEVLLLKTRGSITFTFDIIKPLSKKVNIYYGPKVGFNTNETILLNTHIGSEYFLHKKGSISAEIGANYLIDRQDYFQTTSSIIVRFYL